MANPQFNSISGQKIKTPTTFKIERYKITNLDRLASGTAVGDLIAKKRKFYFTYDAIDSDDLDHILDLIWENDDIFYDLEYIENNVKKSAKVYVGSIPQNLHRPGGKWIWKNVSFDLIEQ